MTLEQLVQSFEQRLTRLAQVARLFWRGSRGLRQDELERLLDEFDAVQTRLQRIQGELSSARQRRDDNQIAAALLASRIDACIQQGRGPDAYRHAMELESL